MRLACLFPAAISVLCLATSAEARQVYEGRDAQGLQCAALIGAATVRKDVAGRMDPAEYDRAVLHAALILQHLPGTDEERRLALRQRMKRLLRDNTADEIFAEYQRSSGWCVRNFLK